MAAIEREVIYKLRVEGADSVATGFERAKKAATEAADHRVRETKRGADNEKRLAREVTRFDENELMSRLRAQSRAIDQAQRDSDRKTAEKRRAEKRAADDAVREQARASAEAERHARRSEMLQEQSNKKLLAGTQQAVSSITSLMRSAVLLWAANEEEADKMLRTLARFEAGAQFVNGLIDGVQSLVTLWEAAEAAAKAYATAQAATTVANVASGATAVGSAGATATGTAAGAVAGGGIAGAIGGVISWLTGVATAVGGAFASVGAAITAVVGAIALAGAELLYRVTGWQSFSVGGAIEGGARLAGFGVTGEEMHARQRARINADREADQRNYANATREYEMQRAMRGAGSQYYLGENDPNERINYLMKDRDTRLRAISAIRPDGGAGDVERGKLAQEALQYEMQILELRKQSGEVAAEALRKQIQAAKAATDAAEASFRSIQDRQRSTYERIANMNPEERMVLNAGLEKDLAYRMTGKLDKREDFSLPEANALRGLGLGGESTADFFKREAESSTPILAEMFKEAIDRARMDRIEAATGSLRMEGKAAAATTLNISGDVKSAVNLNITFDDTNLRRQAGKVMDALKPIIDKGIMTEAHRTTEQAILGQAAK